MTAPQEIIDLVEKFNRGIERYKSTDFNEQEIRTTFILPMFAALGWNTYQEQDTLEVKEEESIVVDGIELNPDYSFILDNRRRFIVEVKKPSVNIESNIHAAFQLRRYAWSVDLPISILTDFEEFSVYYCLTRPFKDDKATRSRLLYLRYDQYVERWKEISDLFSRDSVLNGSLDAYIRSVPDKKGTKRVDAALLDDISEWRNDLAINIAKNNPIVSQKNLNFSVQAIIDRILFLRICEDRAIEPYGRLKQKAEGTGIYNGLGYLFQEADQRYNSGLFHFKEERGRNEPPDNITMNLTIDDNLLRDLILNLYYPNSLYIFSLIPVEILGQVYEQFLGKVIRLDENHIAEVEDKPEVKKAGGVKYTPAYIVQYIVNGTLGPLLKDKNHPNEVALIYVLDPACGSGSFLLVAYQYLLDWHLDWYIKNLAPELDKKTPITSLTIKKLLPIDIEESDNGKSQKTKMGAKAKKIRANAESRAADASVPIYKTPDGIWHLKITERKRILLNNIYGVDIDRQAVEVTKLSLLLKVLEGENQQTVSDLLKFLHERALPDLGENIKCGNSLIGWDILKDNPNLTQAEIDRINPFDWEREFPEVFQNGGFSVVIGNPPYVRIQVMKEWAPLEVEYYKLKYASASKGNYDIYVVFVEKGLNLLNESGRLGYILPHKFFNVKYGQPLRNILSAGKYLSEIVHFGDQQVFAGATTYTCLLFLDKVGSTSFSFQKVNDLIKWQSSCDSAVKGIIPMESATAAE